MPFLVAGDPTVDILSYLVGPFGALVLGWVVIRALWADNKELREKLESVQEARLKDSLHEQEERLKAIQKAREVMTNHNTLLETFKESMESNNAGMDEALRVLRDQAELLQRIETALRNQ